MRLAVLLLGLAWAGGAAALYESNSDVVVLTADNFKQKLTAGPALVEFYAPW
jgi:hypothetical protein